MGGSQEFLIGHNGHVSCFAISKNGTYIASGEETATGFPVCILVFFAFLTLIQHISPKNHLLTSQAYIIIWDFKTKQKLYQLRQHKGKVQSLSFSPSEQYLVSLGGLDDKDVVVWNVEQGKASLNTAFLFF